MLALDSGEFAAGDRGGDGGADDAVESVVVAAGTQGPNNRRAAVGFGFELRGIFSGVMPAEHVMGDEVAAALESEKRPKN